MNKVWDAKPQNIFLLKNVVKHTHYTLKRESLVGTLEAPRGVRQMNGVPQSGADRSATAEGRVRVYWSNRSTVYMRDQSVLLPK